MTTQTVLPVQLSDHSTFDNFLPGQNKQTLSVLKRFLGSNSETSTCLLWGGFGTGKTHLLLASYKFASDSAYIPLMDMNLEPSCLDDVSDCQLVCIDDVHSIAAQPSWEKALFALFEKMESKNQLLLVSSQFSPAEMKFNLKDLVNRFQARQILNLKALSSEDLKQFLRHRASLRGLEFSDQVIRYILDRFSRDSHSLIRLLNKIDHSAMESQRRVTIPFLKQL